MMARLWLAPPQVRFVPIRPQYDLADGCTR